MVVTFIAENVDTYLTPSFNRSDLRHYRINYLLEEKDVTNFDLDEGFEGSVPVYGREMLESILAYLVREKERNPLKSLKECTNSDFVCNRGLLINLCLSIHEPEKLKVLRAARFRNVIFLLQEELTVEEHTKSDTLMFYRGMKFEQLMTEQVPCKSPAKNAQNREVMLAKVEENDEMYRILYSGEVDAVDDLIEIKLSANYGRKSWWRQKSLFWYLQSFFVNIQRIFVGKRLDSKVLETTWVTPDEIRFEAEMSNYWNFNQCMGRIFDALKIVRNALKTDGQMIKMNVSTDGWTWSYESYETEADFLLPSSFMDKFEF